MSKIYTALGLMSGTSLDGVDVALLKTDGERITGFGPAMTLSYADAQKSELTEATKAAVRWNFDGPRPNALSAAQDIIDRAHIHAVQRFAEGHDVDLSIVDVIGYHGQTVLHDATRGQTLQLGDGWRLAAELGVPVVSDFRSEDVRRGGQGAPLAPIYHQALADHAALSGTTIVLNLGGVGNVSVIRDGELLASDTGPANGPLDSFLAERAISVDDRGAISGSGVVDYAILDQWLNRGFFKRNWPRSADRYDFDVIEAIKNHSTADGAITLCAFCVFGVVQTLNDMGVERPDRIIVCGGGRHNRTIMTMLQIELNCPVRPAESLGWNSDAIEAQAFAYLAVRVLRGLPNSFPTTTGVNAPVVGGKVDYPQVS